MLAICLIELRTVQRYLNQLVRRDDDTMISPRGSLWKKWDLHIHTPASFHWNGGKQFRFMTTVEKEESLAEIVRTINQSDIAVFGIMDYWTFDGYWEIRNFIERSGQEFGRRSSQELN